MRSTLTLAHNYLMPNYGEMGLEILSGKGAYVITRYKESRKKKCLDLLCGLGVNSLGHCHPAVVAAITEQAAKLIHASNLYATEPMAELAKKLAKLTGYCEARVFFCNSGTEANEAAGKLARIRANNCFGPKKNKIISLISSFHGRTFLSISMTGQDKMQDKFAPIVPGIKFVPLNDVATLKRAIDKNVCAVIFETIQAEGGINMMSQSFYDCILDLSQKYHFLRIVDEVQTGIGRTGTMFSFNHFGKQQDYEGPEIITIAKALGGGLPIGAVIARGDTGHILAPGSHAATFGGNPVVCAAALAVLRVIECENLLPRVHALGDEFINELQGIATKYCRKIKEVRGKGFMIGVELDNAYKASTVVAAMREKGVLVGTAGSQVVRFLPPFIVTREELNTTLKKFEQVIISQ